MKKEREECCSSSLRAAEGVLEGRAAKKGEKIGGKIQDGLFELITKAGGKNRQRQSTRKKVSISIMSERPLERMG